MEGARKWSLRTDGIPPGRTAGMLVAWGLFALVAIWVWQRSWVHVDPFASEFRIGRGRLLSVVALPTLLVTLRTIAVAAGWLPFLWLRQGEDGAVTVRTALGWLGLSRWSLKARRLEDLTIRVDARGARPTRPTLPAWATIVSNGEREFRLTTWGPVDESRIRAKLLDPAA